MGRRYKSSLKSVAEMKRMHAKERKDLRVKQKRQLERLKLARKAEAHYAKTGHWPRWWSKKIDATRKIR